MDLTTAFLLFIIYSFIGWISEMVTCIITNKKITNRGFLVGPICPIYGVASILFVLLFQVIELGPVALFFTAMYVCGMIEYLASYIMEKIFKARWWDYSNEPFNINGRVCLKYMFLFGIGVTFVIYIINPFLMNVLSAIPASILDIVAIVTSIIFVLDIIVSSKVILKFKNVVRDYAVKDNTTEVTEYVKNTLTSKHLLQNRLIRAFPSFESKIKELLNKKFIK